MALAANPPDPKMNRLLGALTPADYDALMAKARLVNLKFRKQLHAQDKPIDAVYFPITCMISLLVADAEGTPQIEVATVGIDGTIGASEVLQGQRAMGLTVVQLPGIAARIGAEDFESLLRSEPRLTMIINQYGYALMRQILYGTACNQKHSMQQRCARWLLMTQDRALMATFPLTQDFLAHMLGVRRATVNEATGALKSAGLIRYVRGVVTVLNREGLESAACSCYREIARVYDSILPLNSPPLA